VNPRYLHIGLALAALLLLVLALWEESTSDAARTGIQPRPQTARRALSAIPKQARFVLSIDLAAPGATQLRDLLFNTDHELEGLGKLSDVCGYDPSPHIRELVIAAFTDTDDPAANAADPQFAIVATGNFEHERLVGCAKNLVTSRGGTPEHQRVKALTLVRDRDKQGHEIAILESGLVLVANHASLRAMLDVLDGHIPDITQSQTHRSLAKALGKNPVALATLELGSAWLTRLIEQEDISRSRLKGLEAAGWSLAINRHVTLRGLLRCKAASDCQKLEEFLRELVKKLSPFLEQRLGKHAFNDISLRQNGAALEVLWVLTPATLTSMLRQVGQRSATPSNRQPSPPSAGSAKPNETIFAKP
jgi:hypothetical protein